MNKELHIVKLLLEEELKFLNKYIFYSNMLKKNSIVMNDINEQDINLLNEYYQHSLQANSVIEIRQNLLTRICNSIEDECEHIWETDQIDIDPDRSQTIIYCIKCKKNKI